MPDSPVIEPSEIELPAFYQDTETVRKDFANLFRRIAMMDADVGKIVQELKNNGLYDNTIFSFIATMGAICPDET
ncbi:MAG TPA: hypothetical protein ENH60_09050 [Pricia sp.]|nr:hypothetical protein [Pricia sp.]